jgi:hypothetical protein
LSTERLHVLDDRPSSEGAAGRGLSEAQRHAVTDEMKLILEHPIFRSSNRCVALLHYVVDCALAGRQSEIKERTLGVEVFGRNANYDVSADPIVRRIANDVRKRLAQYYQEQEAGHGVKIYLVRGSYLPEFEFVSQSRARETADARAAEQSFAALKLHEPPIAHWTETQEEVPRMRRRTWVLGVVGAMAVAAACFMLISFRATHAPLYKVWKPLFDSSNPIIVCVSDEGSPIIEGERANSQQADSTTASQSAAQQAVSANPNTPKLVFRDAVGGNTITAMLSNYKKQVSLRPSSSLKFQDFRQGPVVLIGGLNNPWGPTMLSGLRYSLQFDPVSHFIWIRDARNPGSREWELNGKLGAEPPSIDYALITRVFDQDSRQWIISVGGLGAWGTEAAAELVSDPNYARQIPTSITDKGNFQMILKTSIISGEPGPLQVVAVYTW